MIHWLIEGSLRNRFLVIMGFLLIGGWGYWALLTTPIDAIPDLSVLSLDNVYESATK